MSNEQRSLPPTTIIDLYWSMRSYSGRPSFLMGSFQGELCLQLQTDKPINLTDIEIKFLLSGNQIGNNGFYRSSDPM